MISLPSCTSLSLKLPLLHHYVHFKSPSKPQIPTQRSKKNRDFRCRAEFSQDAPFAVAIGASILNSLVFPLPKTPDDDGDSDSGINSTDARFAVMGIISFVPYFNWLSWIFAWLDTSSPRYLVYSIIYLAPYIRTNLSLSPEESWLPIASIILCIIHIQIEASIRNGDLQGFQIFNEARKSVSQFARKDDFEIYKGTHNKGRKQEQEGLPSAKDHSRNELHGWGVSEERSDKKLEEEEDLNR